MADVRTPFAHRADDLAAIGTMGSAVTVAEVPLLTQVGLRADIGSASDLALPLVANSVVTDGDRSTLWLGPDEWLVTAPPGAAPTIVADLHALLDGYRHACVDLSANRGVLDLDGVGALEVLDRGCSLDLHPSRWVAGMCAQTNLARTQVILEQRHATTRIFVRPSFADYLVDWLMSAASAAGT